MFIPESFKTSKSQRSSAKSAGSRGSVRPFDENEYLTEDDDAQQPKTAYSSFFTLGMVDEQPDAEPYFFDYLVNKPAADCKSGSAVSKTPGPPKITKCNSESRRPNRKSQNDKHKVESRCSTNKSETGRSNYQSKSNRASTARSSATQISNQGNYSHAYSKMETLWF